MSDETTDGELVPKINKLALDEMNKHAAEIQGEIDNLTFQLSCYQELIDKYTAIYASQEQIEHNFRGLDIEDANVVTEGT
jgi:hypothetical protein